MKKAVSLILVLLTLISLFCACGEVEENPVTTTNATVESQDPNVTTEDPYHDKDGYLLDSLPDLNFNNQEIIFLYDTEFQYTEFFSDDLTGEAISDAIHARNLAVEDRLKVKFKFVGQAGNYGNQQAYLAKAQADLQSDCDYSIYAAYSRTVPLLAYNGLCMNLHESDYFDPEKPWWPKALTDECTIHDILYFCTGDISTNTIWMMSCMFYNSALYENLHMDTTLENIVFDGKWTIEKFSEIIKNAYIEGADESSTYYGMSCTDTCVDAFLNAAGVISIDKDGNGDLKLSDDFIGERTLNVVENLGNLFTTTKAAYISDTENGGKKPFYDGHALFILDGSYVVTGNDSGNGIGFDYGLVPVPKYNEEQQNYVTNLRYSFNMYAVNAHASDENKKIGSAVIEALASDSYRRVTPILFETTMKTRYSRDDNASKIYDILRENVVFDLGRLHNFSINNYYPTFRQYTIKGGKNWASNITAISKTMKKVMPALTKIYVK